jgi:hypothetical protein
VTATTTASTSQCKTGGALSYNWSLTAGNGELLTPGGTTSLLQSVTTTAFNKTYTFSLTVHDDTVNLDSTPVTATFSTSECGQVAPTVSFGTAGFAKQHFNNFNKQTPAAPLDIEQVPPATEPTVDRGPDGRFPVPFYLGTPVSLRAQITSQPGGACSSFGFVSAQLLDPDGIAVPAAANFTGPAAGSVANGGTLDFSFTPRIGDRGTGLAFVPGNYQLMVTITYGRTATPSEAVLSGPLTRVSGRCGLNLPFTDATFSPVSPTNVGTQVTATSTSSDADNDTLLFLTSAPPASTRSSTGCGLDQPLSLASPGGWTFGTRPAGSATAFDTPFASPARFTPDVAGRYEVRLTESDGTTSPAGWTPGNGTASQVFPYDAQPVLVFTTQPTHGTTNVPLANVVVTFINAGNVPCTTCSGTVTLSLASGPGTLGPPANLTQTGTGSVTFTGLTLSAAGTSTLSASSPNFGSGVSSTIVVSDPSLAFSAIGAQTVSSPFAFTVTAQDFGGGTLTTLDGATVTVIVNTGPAGGQVCNGNPLPTCVAVTATLTSGVASFAGVQASVASPPDYVLRASAAGASDGSSNAFTVNP